MTKTIEIKNRFSGNIIISGKYLSVKDCLEKNKEADLSEADLSGVNLSKADLSGVDLYGANLYGVDLREANLYGADLRGANLRGANLRGANLRKADLREVHFCEADLRKVDLREANLYGADLRGANLYGADLSGANLRGANLRGADLRETKLTLIQGTRHFLQHTNDVIQIGCYKRTIQEWLDNYKQIGKENNYTNKEIEEYGKYIKMIAEKEKLFNK